MNCRHLTINLEGVENLRVTRRSFREDGQHVQEVIERHVARPVMTEHLTDASLEWVFLSKDED